MDSQYVIDAYESLWSPGGWGTREWLLGRGLEAATIQSASLGWDAARRSIVMPYFNPDGTVRSYRWRNMNREPKYESQKGGRVHLYNVVATREPRVWICEGEFDALLLCQLGYPAVGVAGTQNFKPEWKYLFVHCDEVSIVFDGDDAGRTASRKITGHLAPYVTKLRMIQMPDEKDVTDLYKENAEALKELVA